MQELLKKLNETISENPNKEFITYGYNNSDGRRLSCFGKRVDNTLYIKVYVVNPKEQFDKKLIKEYHKKHGYFSESGTLHTIKCVHSTYKDLFFETLDRFYILNEELVALMFKKELKKKFMNVMKNQFKIQQKQHVVDIEVKTDIKSS